MVKWKYTLDISDFYHKYDEELTIQEVGKKMAQRIRANRLYKQKEYQDELEDIAFEFENVEDVEEFDGIMDTLYDLADTKGFEGGRITGLCWIKTR